MSSDELQGTSGYRAKDSSEMDYDVDSLPSSSDERSLDTNIQPTVKQSSCTDKSKRIQCETATGFDNVLPANKPLASAVEENKLFCRRKEQIQNITEFLSKATSSSNYSNEKPHGSNPSSTKDAFLKPTSEPKEKADKRSSPNRRIPIGEFSLSPSDMPFTKQKLAESVSLEEACGYLPYLMKTKRVDLRCIESNLDQISANLQLALGEAKNICILLENSPKDIPEDINAARVQAQKLMYLLGTSFRIFEKLDRLGKALKKSIEVYSKQTGDYHASVDTLLEYIMENIIEKCRQIRKNL